MRNDYQIAAHHRQLFLGAGLLMGFMIGTPASYAQSRLPEYRVFNATPPPAGYLPMTSAPTTKKAATSTVVTTNSLTDGQYDDIQLFPSANPQSEVHISIDKTNPSDLIASANTQSQGFYYSRDGGQTWTGSDNLPNGGQSGGDPSTAYDAAGNAYLATLAPKPTFDGYFVQSSTNKGVTWTNQVRSGGGTGRIDKEMIAADNLPSSLFVNNLYGAWTNDVSGTVQFNRSTNRGQTFTAPLVLQSGFGLGANVQTGPNGEVYVCWPNYASGSPTATGIGFTSSTNGGVSFTPATVAFGIVGMAAQGDHPDPVFNNVRVNDLPAMAVDKGTAHRGRIYITHTAKENGNGKAVVLVRFSDNQGASWSAPVTASIPNGRQNWFPWIAVDDCTGDVSVVYYSFDTASGFWTNTYVAYSTNGGSSFSNIKVSDVPHTTAPIDNIIFAAGYIGDYLGITAYGGKAYPVWADNRNGT